MRITRHNTVDDNEIEIDELKTSKASKLVKNKSEISSVDINEVLKYKLLIIMINLMNYQVDEGDLVSKIIKQGSSKTKTVEAPFQSEDDEPAEVAKVDESSTKTENNCLLEPAKIKEIVDQVTSNITGTLQTLVVSDRVLAAERNSSEWKKLCHLMVNNPEIINNRMLLTDTPAHAIKHFGPDFSELNKVCNYKTIKLNYKVYLGHVGTISDFTDIHTGLESYDTLWDSATRSIAEEMVVKGGW